MDTLVDMLPNFIKKLKFDIYTNTHTYKYPLSHTYVCLYIYMCVCVCLSKDNIIF